MFSINESSKQMRLSFVRWMTLTSVDTLSDDETTPPCTKKSSPLKPSKLFQPCRPRSKRFKQRGGLLRRTVNPQKLRHLINSKCGCAASCFEPFRKNWSLWDSWIRARKLMAKMTKLEKDKYAKSSAFPTNSLNDSIRLLFFKTTVLVESTFLLFQGL